MINNLPVTAAKVKLLQLSMKKVSEDEKKMTDWPD